MVGATFRSLTQDDLPNIDILNKSQNPIVLIPNYTFKDVGVTSSCTTQEFLEALIKHICKNYDKRNTMFMGKISQNSASFIWIYIYDTKSVLDSGLPKYCFGEYFHLQTNINDSYTFVVAMGDLQMRSINNKDLTWDTYE